jgi:GT2 family glycosyltransferase
VWQALQGFHEGSTLYAEDIDLCWRVRNRGWRIWFTSDAEFVHLRSGTTSRHWGDARRAEMIGRSEAAMIRRNLSPLSSRLTLSFIKSGLALRSIAFAVLGRREASETVRGALRGYHTRPDV